MSDIPVTPEMASAIDNAAKTVMRRVKMTSREKAVLRRAAVATVSRYLSLHTDRLATEVLRE